MQKNKSQMKYCAFHNSVSLREDILEQLGKQKEDVALRTLNIDGRDYEVYGGSIGREEINFHSLSRALGIPKDLLLFSLPCPDWAGYYDQEQETLDTINDLQVFFQSIPVGRSLAKVLNIYILWLLKEPRFGAARFSNELGELLPETIATTEKPGNSCAVLKKLTALEAQLEEEYIELYDSDLNIACRKSRAAQVVNLMARFIDLQQNDTYLNLDVVVDALNMGSGLADDLGYFKVRDEMEKKLYQLFLHE